MKVLINTQERFLKNNHNYIYWTFRGKEKEKKIGRDGTQAILNILNFISYYTTLQQHIKSLHTEQYKICSWAAKLQSPTSLPPRHTHRPSKKKKMFPWTSLLLFVFCFLVFIFLSYLALSVTKHTIETPLLISYTCIALYSLHTLPCLLQSIPVGTPPLTSYIAPSWHRTLLDQLCLKLQYQKKKM